MASGLESNEEVRAAQNHHEPGPQGRRGDPGSIYLVPKAAHTGFGAQPGLCGTARTATLAAGSQPASQTRDALLLVKPQPGLPTPAGTLGTGPWPPRQLSLTGAG